LGDGAGGYVDVYVAGLEEVGIDAVLGGVAAHPGERGLHRFLHDGAELPGHDEAFVAAGHAAGFDEQDVAAHRGPGETDGHAGAAGAVGDFGIGAVARRTEILLDYIGGDDHLLAGAFGDAAGLLAADGADLALQAADAGFAGVAAHDEAHGVVGELDVLFDGEAVLGDLPRDEVAEGDDRLFLFGVAFERDDFHAVAQGVGHGVEDVGGGDEEDLGEVKGNVEVVVAVGGILFGVEDFEEGAGGVAAEIAAQLIDFVEHEDGVVGTGTAEGLDDLSGQGADVGAAVAADFGLVVHSAHGDTGEFAAQ